jgi:hypothetical protein
MKELNEMQHAVCMQGRLQRRITCIRNHFQFSTLAALMAQRPSQVVMKLG